jgi:flagellar basal body rod protein FlgG
MLRGIYTSTAGMAAEMNTLEVLSNNLANVNTVGYKEDFQSHLREDAHLLSYGMGGLVRGTAAIGISTRIDIRPGNYNTTNNPLDLAIQGNGMFGLQLPDGTVAYTRNGRFHCTDLGQLANESGQLVLDGNGLPIVLPDPQGEPFNVTEDGTISLNSVPLAQVGVFNASDWSRAGNGLYLPVGTVGPATDVTIHSGMVEQSNTDLTSTMGRLMSAQRAYQASSQFQRMQDQLLQQSITDLGRVG